jgi:hypothetical protein
MQKETMVADRYADRRRRQCRGAQRRGVIAGLVCSALLTLGCGRMLGEASEPAALAVVKQAVAAELNAERTDKTPWEYRDHDVEPGKDAVYQVIETPKGDLRRLLELNGKVLSGSAAAREADRLRSFVNSPEEQARRQKAAESDGAQAREFLRSLPEAFVWTVVNETPQAVLLKFHPNPDFTPPDMQSRVLSVMAGQMLVARDGNRIQSLRGTLTDDVKFGFGLFGKIDRGGTFNVERRELAPGKWQITETHVHIGGRALLFKTIGQQEDEVKTEWHISEVPDLQAALRQLTH